MMELQNPNYKLPNNSKIPTSKSGGRGKPYDLKERLLQFARNILLVCKKLPKMPECDGIRRQLARAGTSIGANFEESDGALTKKDFVNKVGIARKEAKETMFWLRKISDLYVARSEIVSDIKESEEIISILSTILIKSGAKRQR